MAEEYTCSFVEPLMIDLCDDLIRLSVVGSLRETCALLVVLITDVVFVGLPRDIFLKFVR